MFKALERRLEKLVEGSFNTALKSGLQPVELGRRLIKIMDSQRTVGVRGSLIVPNDFVIRLSVADYQRLSTVTPALKRDLILTAKDHAAAEGYRFAGQVAFAFEADTQLKTGTFAIDALANSETVGDGPVAVLTLSDGSVRALELDAAFVIGRNDDCTLTIADANVSRIHAEIKADDQGFVVTDNNSTNGTLVNGNPITTARLRNDDVITIGPIQARFNTN
jgi:hypothetical protein